MSVRLPNPMNAVVWLAFLVPTSLFGGWVDRSFGVAVCLLGCAVLLAKPSPWEARKASARALRTFLLLELLYVVSALYSAAFNGIEIGPSGCFELLRYVLIGVFVVYLIRHYDAEVRGVVEWAMTAALYIALLFPSADPQGYVSIMTLCSMIFFSRQRLRFLHAVTALFVVFFSGARASWMAAFLILSVALSVCLYQDLARRRVESAAQCGLIFFALLLASPAVYLRASRPAARAPSATSEAETLQFIRRSPIFGWGPVDGAAIPGRSQYLFWTLKGGALGAGLILAGLMLVGYRLLRGASGNMTHLAGAAAFLASVSLMLATSRFLESFRLVFLTSFFMAGIHEASR